MENGIIVDVRQNNVQRRARDGRLSITIKSGSWHINRHSGKALCRVNLDIPSLKAHIDFVPSHNFCGELLDKMLDCELQNDRFKFAKPALGELRPPQFEAKLTRLFEVLDKWKARSNEIPPIEQGEHPP